MIPFPFPMRNPAPVGLDDDRMSPSSVRHA
jgi:hypothetical protein